MQYHAKVLLHHAWILWRDRAVEFQNTVNAIQGHQDVGSWPDCQPGSGERDYTVRRKYEGAGRQKQSWHPVTWIDGPLSASEWRDAPWARFCTGTSARQAGSSSDTAGTRQSREPWGIGESVTGHQPIARRHRRQGARAQVHNLSDRLLPSRCRRSRGRSQDRPGQALPPRGDRPHQQVRLRPARQENRKNIRPGLPEDPRRRRALQDPHHQGRHRPAAPPRQPQPVRSPPRQLPETPTTTVSAARPQALSPCE